MSGFPIEILGEDSGRESERDGCRKLALDLCGAFSWRISPQGYDYWESVYRNLLRLAGEMVAR